MIFTKGIDDARVARIYRCCARPFLIQQLKKKRCFFGRQAIKVHERLRRGVACLGLARQDPDYIIQGYVDIGLISLQSHSMQCEQPPLCPQIGVRCQRGSYNDHLLF